MDSSRIQEIILKVNGNDAEKTIKHIQGVIEKAREEKEKLAKEDTSKWGDKEWKRWQQLNREIERGEKQLKKYGTNATYVKQVLDDLNGKSLNDLQASLKTMQRILDRGLVPRGGDEWKQLTEAIAKTKEQIEKVKSETNSVGEAIEETKEKSYFLSSAFSQIANIGKIFSSFSDKVADYVSQYAAMQEHVAGVSKYTGMAAKDVEELNEEFKKMDTKTSREALNDLAADAGRLGITAKKDVLDFVQAADQINIALGEDLGEGAVKNIGKLANIFGDDKRLGLKQAMLSTASAINELAQTSSASEGNILDFTTRLSSMAKTANMTQAQVMGLGAMFETQGLNADVAATALAKVMQKMGTDTAKMARLAGLNVQEFGNLVKTDMNAALIEFAKGIGRLGGLTEVSPVLKELSLTGAGVSSVVNILAQNLENVATQQEIATRAFTEGTSATNEAAKANSTAAANLEKARNSARELQQTMGEQLYPIYLKCMEGSAKLSGVLASLSKVVWNNKAAFTILASAIGLLTLNITLANKQTKLAIAVKRSWQAIVVSCKMAAMLFNGALALMTGNTTRAAAAMKLLNNTIKANPYTAVAALIVAIASGLLLWANRSKELSKAEKLRAAEQEAEMEVTKKALEQTKDEEAQIRKLTARIHSNVFSVKERREAVEELKKIIPGYNAEISEEGRITKETTEAVDDYIKKLREKAIVQAGEGALSGLYQQQIELEQKLADAQLKAKDAEVEFRKARKKEGSAQSAIDILANDLKKFPKYSLYGFSKEIKKFGTELRDASAEARELEEELGRTNKKIERTEEIINKKKTEEKPEPKKKPKNTEHTPDPVTPTNTNTTAPATPDRLADNAAAMKQALQDISEQYAQGETQAEEGVSAYAEMLLQQIELIEQYKQEALAIEATDEQRAKHAETLSKEQAAINQKLYQEDLRQLTACKDAELAMNETARIVGKINQEQADQEAYNIQAKYLQDKITLLRTYNADAEKIHEAELEIEKHAAAKSKGISKELADTIAKMKADAMKADPEAARAAAINQIEALKKKLIEEARALNLGEEIIQQLEAYLSKQKHELEVNAEVKANVDIKALSSNLDFGFSGFAASIQKVFKRRKKERAADAKDEQKTQDKQAKDEEKAENKRQRRRKKNRDKDTADAKKENKKQKKDAEKTEQEKMDAAVDIASTANEMIQSIGSATTSLFQANCELETAKIEQEYATRIAAAEGNEELQQQLEEEKNAKIAATRQKYADKEFKVKIITALADTAANAVKAYGAAGGNPWLGAVFAAMAVAAGMIQVATIKKQHEAQKATGYYTGGYTGGTDWRKPAGIVHEGEYVVPHEALANPAVTPMLNIIETARRSNRLASLTPEDVSRSISAPQIAAAMAGRTAANTASAAAAAARTANNTAAPVVTIKDGDQTAAAVRRLNRKLDEGIESYVVLSGPQGLDHQWKRYQRLTGK